MALFSIGHSTRSLDNFIDLCRKWNVDTIADVRSFPGSKRYPHFNIENLRQSLPDVGIKYLHFKELGGRRKNKDDEGNFAAWTEDGFRYYAAYAYSSNEFEIELQSLLSLAKSQNVAMMCSEAVWWRCHRRILTDYAIVNHTDVNHILSLKKCDVAKITPFADSVIVSGKNRILYKEVH